MQTLNLSIPAPFLTVKAYAELTGQTPSAVSADIAAGKLPVYIPPHPPEQNASYVKKHINMVALYAIAAKSADIDLNIANNA